VRYSDAEYVYGTAPNEFLVSVADQIPRGRVLSLAEGEGRNAVYLAELGCKVLGVDASAVGMSKAQRLADERGVTIETRVADLADFHIEPDSWDAIVSIFCHLPRPVRRTVHQAVRRALRPGGAYVCEAYTPRQLAFRTGGPSVPELLVTLDDLRTELAGLEFVVGREVERDVVEGNMHRGRSAVVQVLAVRSADA